MGAVCEVNSLQRKGLELHVTEHGIDTCLVLPNGGCNEVDTCCLTLPNGGSNEVDTCMVLPTGTCNPDNIHDTVRAHYITSSLAGLQASLDSGAPVSSYQLWSLL